MQRSCREKRQRLRGIGVLGLVLLASLNSGLSTQAQQNSSTIADFWRYTLQQPADGWQQAGFDDSGWKEGNGGCGSRGTPAARIGTPWNSSDIWLRKSFGLQAVPEDVALLIHHDEDAEIFINGNQVATLPGYTVEYTVVPLDAAARDSLRQGDNLLAVSCHQTGGGQFIDVHVVDADNVPQLPPAKRNSSPFRSQLITEWGAAVTAKNAWTEYPRPQLVRDQWQNLNGLWDYAVTADDVTRTPSEWAGKILVPYALESKLSGVQRLLEPNEALWYRRSFQVSPPAGQRTLLNFEAVDYHCEVFINGTSVGNHQGGNTPFSFDVTDAVRDGDNELVVRVEDDTERWQLRGKQVLDPHGIWYTQMSGIWQTVWLEHVPSTHIRDLKIATDADTGTIHVRPYIASNEGAGNVRVIVKDGAAIVADVTQPAGDFSITINDARLWSPTRPHLYDLEVSLPDEDPIAIDTVRSCAGIRSVGQARDENGHLRFTLNGEVLFHWGPLDQGWWPDGLLTPPSDEAMLFDIEYLKAAGFNMIRKHIKVEPRRYYYHCDRLGMLVWQDQVAAGHNPPWTRLEPNPADADWPDEHHEQYLAELERMIDRLENHPSIVVWVPFNEAWGQHRTMDVGRRVVERDPSRLVNVASGGNFWPVGDVVDHHAYPHPEFPFDAERYADFIKVMGEFGGHGYPVKGHLWDADRDNWGYGGLPQNEAEYKARYVTSLEKLNDLRRQGIAAGVYTQTTDVEGEINGLMTYDRKVIKIRAQELAELHRQLFEP